MSVCNSNKLCKLQNLCGNCDKWCTGINYFIYQAFKLHELSKNMPLNNFWLSLSLCAICRLGKTLVDLVSFKFIPPMLLWCSTLWDQWNHIWLITPIRSRLAVLKAGISLQSLISLVCGSLVCGWVQKHRCSCCKSLLKNYLSLGIPLTNALKK